MLFVFSSLIVAMAVGLGAHAYYGTEELINHAWVAQVTYSIIAAGLVVEALSWVRCALCRRSKFENQEGPYSICGARTCNE
jgi:hypothetical protein